jgi:protein TonB
MSRRLGEQGKVLVRVYIDANGQPQRAELKQSSGYERLDETALNTVLKWRYLPGKRNGLAEAMWLQVPLEFRLE